MIQKTNRSCFLSKWLVFLPLLAVTGWFPSAREAQSLCLRWFFHLHGDTFVQGQPAGGDIWLIPNVKFTPGFTVKLQQQSASSLENFALTTANRDWMKLPPPGIQPGWTNSALLSWMTFLTAVNAPGEIRTNAISTETLNLLLALVHLSEISDPANGAYCQAEAALEFAARDDPAALKALAVSSSIGNWNAGAASAYAELRHRFEQAGLSRLDAAFTAAEHTGDAFVLPGMNLAHLNRLMVRAVTDSQLPEFRRLFKLLVELRRMDWTDKTSFGTAYRRFQPTQELIQAMANQMNRPWPADRARQDYRRTSQKIFQEYLDLNADQATTVQFNAQTEAYQTESKLRMADYTQYVSALNDLVFYNQVSGMLTFLLLTLLGSSGMFGVVSWQINHGKGLVKQWPPAPEFWLLAFVVVAGSAAMTTHFLNALGAGVPVGPFLPEPDDRVASQLYLDSLGAIFVVFFMIFSARLAVLLNKWRGGQIPIRPWLTTRWLAVAFLISALVMAFSRNQLVAVISSRYQ